jgi:hypothetical protein
VEFFHGDILEDRKDGASKTSGAVFWEWLKCKTLIAIAPKISYNLLK